MTSLNAAVASADHGVRRAVVQLELVGAGIVDPAAREHHPATSPVISYGASGPKTHSSVRCSTVAGSSRSSSARPDAVDRAVRGRVDAVVHDEPAVGGLERRRPEADLAGVPPGAVARLEQELVVAPVAQVGRVREPHVRAAAQRRGPVDHRPAAVEPAREQRRVLVLGRHHRAEPADAPEVARHRQRDERSAAAVGGVGDRPFLALREPGQPRILAAPGLLGVAVDVGAQERLGIEAPVRDAVARCARRGAGRSRAGPRRGPAGSSRRRPAPRPG